MTVSKIRKAGDRVVGLLVFLAVGAALAWAAGRTLTHFLAAPEGPAGYAEAAETLLAAIAADPLSIDLSEPAVATACAFCLLAPLLMGLGALSRGMRLDNEDTAHQHGDARLATDKEKGALVDRRHPANNLMFSEHVGVPVYAYDGRTRAAVKGMNLNSICIGISGLGKTFNGVSADLMQCVGERVAGMEYGIRNIPAHITGWWVWEALRGGSGGRRRARPVAPAPTPKRAEKTAPPDAEGLIAEVRRRREGRKAEIARIGAGFDVVCTDPKGQLLPEMGHLFEAAGYDIKCVDTVDFSALRYNPLAYVRERYVDSVDPDSIEVSVRVDAPGAGCQLRVSRVEADASEPSGFRASARLALDTSVEGVVATSVPDGATLESVSKALEKCDPKSPEAKELRAQHTALWLRGLAGDAGRDTSRGAFERENENGDGSKHKGTLESTLRNFKYRRTAGRLELELENASSLPVDAAVEIDLGRSLVTTGALMSQLPGAALEAGPREGVLVWRPGRLHAPRPGRSAAPGTARLVISVSVAPMRVADAVDLVKVVDTLASNLRGADAEDGKCGDGRFWEEIKRVQLMGDAAFLFERYDDPKYRTIPEMLRVINMATPDADLPEGSMSPLAVLMKEWEHGVVFDSEATAAPGVRGRTAGGRWRAKEGARPHSRNVSLALHCYKAYAESAEETFRSVIVTVKSAMINVLPDDVRDFLSADEVGLATLGDAGSPQVIFLKCSDTNRSYDFITALFLQQAIDLAVERANGKPGGRHERHVRFVLDEAANIGKIPVLTRSLSVVRSRNVSISLYLQSRSQLEGTYGKADTTTIYNNCSTLTFLGAQDAETLEEMSKKIGEETVFGRIYTRSFDGGARGTTASEQITSSARAVMSPSQIEHLSKGSMLVFIYNRNPALDVKFQTQRHPLFPYVYPGRRSLLQPPCAVDGRFDYADYLRRRGVREKPRSEAFGEEIPEAAGDESRREVNAA